jgi:hypothetical protein
VFIINVDFFELIAWVISFVIIVVYSVLTISRNGRSRH